MLYDAHGIEKFIVICGYTDLPSLNIADIIDLILKEKVSEAFLSVTEPAHRKPDVMGF